MTVEELKGLAYRLVYGPYYRYLAEVKHKGAREALDVMTSQETVDYIVRNRCCVSRYGDGELGMVVRYLNDGDGKMYDENTFQSFDKRLAQRLWEVLSQETPGVLCCILYALKDFRVYEGYERFYFEREFARNYHSLFEKMQSMGCSMRFGDASFTRFYLSRKDIKDKAAYAKGLKRIWEGQDVVFIEGEHSRLGVGNDLFDNAKSIERVLVPSKNAFAKYDEILACVKTLPKGKLYLLAIGHTATVLACDMAQMGFWAIDLGHVDIEYEWMLRKATKKIAIPDKYVNEVHEGRIDTELADSNYQNQIIRRVL